MHLDRGNRRWFTCRPETLSAAVFDRPRRTHNHFGHCALLRRLGMASRVTRAYLSNLSTQLRPVQTRNIGSLPLPARQRTTLKRAIRSEISASTIGHRHRVQTDTKPSAKSISVNGDHFHTWWISHVSKADVLLCHRYQRGYIS